jgi:hypothetical protein
MGLFKRKNQPEIGTISETQALSASFQNVSNDMYNVFRWLGFLNEKMIKIESQYNQIPNSKEDIKKLIDDHYSYQNFHSKIDELNSKLESISARQSSVPNEIEELRLRLRNVATLDDIDRLKSHLRPVETVSQKPKIVMPGLTEISQRLKNLEVKNKGDVRDKFVQRLSRNSKDYVKNVIVNLLQKYQKMPALKLKEMVVDEQGLCSKSSFYRILNEIELQDEVSVVKHAKEKQYFYKVLHNNS